MNLQDQTLLLTGGAGSIGAFLVSKLCHKCKQLIVLDKDQEKLNALKSHFPSIEVFTCDLTEGEAVTNVLTTLYERYPVSVVVNNAGFIHSEPLINILKPLDKKHSYVQWDATIKANLYTTFYVSVNVAEQMVSRRIKGVIINISSISAKGNLGQTAYAAAKAGIEAMTVTWSKELGMFGLRVAAIAPGFFETSSTRDSLSEANVKKWMKAVPLNRLGNLEELVSAVSFIVENDYYNGQTLAINGGLSI